MEFFRDTDVVVIGGGIVGTAILRELSKYDLRCLLVEKEPDLAFGTTKANSAVCHAGFDAPTGSWKAKTNVRGNALYHELQDDLDLDVKWCGSYVCAVTEEQEEQLRVLYDRGLANGVPGLKILTGDEVRKEEPNLKTARAALWAPTAGVLWPFGAALAFARCAVQNGAQVIRDCAVTGFVKEEGRVTIVQTTKGAIRTRFVINAAGIYADRIAALAGDTSFTITPRKGEYILFDKTAAPDLVWSVVFPCPTKTSKGILICTTTHGNTFIGPNANDQEDREDTAVTPAGMDEIIAGARRLVPNLPLGAAITEFAGLRAVSSTGDFVLGASPVPGFLNAAGTQSPGLTSAPAIAEVLVEALGQEMVLRRKPHWNGRLPRRKAFNKMAPSEKQEAIAKNALYGRVICRCETVTEGEIVDAIHEPVGARTVDGVKRRTRAGMGRCQGGFCGPRVVQILARELQVPVSSIVKERAASRLYYEKFAARVPEEEQ